MKYEVVWIESVGKWAVRDNDNDKVHQYVFWSNSKKICEEEVEKLKLRDAKDNENQMTLF